MDNDLEEIPDKIKKEDPQINVNNNIEDKDIQEDDEIKIIEKFPEDKEPNVFPNDPDIQKDDPNVHLNIQNINRDVDINLYGPNTNSKKHSQKKEGYKHLQVRSQSFEIIDIRIKRLPLEKINKNEKELIKKYNNYKTSEGILKLYTLEKEKFYKNINYWLLSLNIEIYKRIGPITGKLTNFLYKLIFTQKNLKRFEGKKNELYRAFKIKKSDIFLYKASEGDIFCYPSFTSTSSTFSVTGGFKKDITLRMKALDEIFNCVIKIDYDLNDKDVYQEADIKNYSEIKNEDERLFPPFSFFKIKKVYFNDGTKDGKNLPKEHIHDGTFGHPFLIELEIIKRDFYLDKAIINKEKFDYIKSANEWQKRENMNISNILD